MEGVIIVVSCMAERHGTRVKRVSVQGKACARGGTGVLVIMHGRSLTTIDRRIPTIRGRVTSRFSPTRQARRGGGRGQRTYSYNGPGMAVAISAEHLARHAHSAVGAGKHSGQSGCVSSSH